MTKITRVKYKNKIFAIIINNNNLKKKGITFFTENKNESSNRFYETSKWTFNFTS